MKYFLVIGIVIACLAISENYANAQAKCTSIQARCAVEIGGECNPKTGRWFYGCWQGRCTGGTIAQYNDCISRKLKDRKK